MTKSILKKSVAIFSAVAVIFSCCFVTSFAAENVAKVGDTEYPTLAKAINAAEDNATIELLSDATIGKTQLKKSLTFNLNGYTITGNEDASYVFSPWAVDTVFNNGIIKMTNTNPGSQAIQVVGGNLTLNDIEIDIAEPNASSDYNYGVKAFASVDANDDKIINDPVKVVVNNSRIYEVSNSNIPEAMTAGVIVIGKNNNDAVSNDMDNRDAVLEINNSEINVSGFAVSGNGAAHGTKIDINNSALTSTVASAIYHPQVGDMNIFGGTITGVTGIEVRAGNVNVSEATNIVATGDPTTVDPNGNGTTTTGAAVAIAQHTTKLPINVTIENATLVGASALVANNPEKNPEEAIANIKIDIQNGQFSGLVKTNGGGAIQASGGTFDKLDSSVEVVADEVAEITDQDGFVTTVLGLDNINGALEVLGENDSVIITKAPANTEFAVPDGVNVKNESGNNIVVNDETLTNDENVTVHVHSWGEPVWNWNSVNDKATATFTCTKDSNHVEILDAKIVTQTTEATCDKEGSIVYTATVTFEGMDYINTKTVSISAEGHNYKDGVCTECGAKDPNFTSSTDQNQNVAGDNTDVNKESDTPKTGDDTMLLGYVILMLAALGIGGTLVVNRKKN